MKHTRSGIIGTCVNFAGSWLDARTTWPPSPEISFLFSPSASHPSSILLHRIHSTYKDSIQTPAILTYSTNDDLPLLHMVVYFAIVCIGVVAITSLWSVVSLSVILCIAFIMASPYTTGVALCNRPSFSVFSSQARDRKILSSQRWRAESRQ